VLIKKNIEVGSIMKGLGDSMSTFPKRLDEAAKETPHEVGPQGGAFKGEKGHHQKSRIKQNTDNQIHEIKTTKLPQLAAVYLLPDSGCDAGNPPRVSDMLARIAPIDT
jgi:hypothetical protein